MSFVARRTGSAEAMTATTTAPARMSRKPPHGTTGRTVIPSTTRDITPSIPKSQPTTVATSEITRASRRMSAPSCRLDNPSARNREFSRERSHTDREVVEAIPRTKTTTATASSASITASRMSRRFT